MVLIRLHLVRLLLLDSFLAFDLHLMSLLLVGLLNLVLLLHFFLVDLVTVHIHHLLVLLLLERGESWIRSSHVQLLVDVCLSLQVLLVLLDCQVHHLEVLALLVLLAYVSSATWNTFSEDLDLLLKVVLLVAHSVDTPDQINVVLHETVVVLTVLLQVASQLLPVVVDLHFVHLAIVCMLSVVV